MADGNRVYLFGRFRLDSRERVLYRDGQPVALTPKLAATLLALVEKHGHIVEKAELMQAVWPETAVEEGNLTQNVYSLRRLLGDRAESGVAIETVPRRGYRFVGEVRQETPVTPSVAVAESRDSTESVSTPVARWLWLGGAIGVALVVGVAIWSTWWPIPLGNPVAAETSPWGGVVPLTSLPGDKVRPALSPDGTRVAFAWNRGDGHHLYVKNTTTDAALLVARDASYSAWSPDGRFIAFIRRFIDERGSRQAAVLIVPALGGSTRQLWIAPERLVDAGLDWSPDGTYLVLSARRAVGQPRRLLLIATASGEERWLTDPPADSNGDNLPIFSPAGEAIAFVRDTELDSHIYVVNLAAGEPRRLSPGGHNIQRLAWDQAGQTLIFWSNEAGRELWRLSISTGEAEPIPGIGEGAGDPSISRLTGRLVFTQVLTDQNLYRVDLPATRESSPRLLVRSTRRDVHGDISPDGSRIAFVSTRSGAAEIWTAQVDGTAPVQTTQLRTDCRNPRWSPDGRLITFAASDARRQHIYVVDAFDGLLRQLTSGSARDNWPTWSHDGRWVYFMSDDKGAREIWKVPSEGGPAVLVTTGGAVRAWESSDGRFLYYATSPSALWRMPAGGGASELVFEFPPGNAWGGEWVPAKNGIYRMNFDARPRPSIEFFDFATRHVSRVFTPPGDYDVGGGFSVSRDEGWLVFGQRDYSTSDIMMIDKLR